MGNVMNFLKFLGGGREAGAGAGESRPATEPSMTTQSQTNIQRELIRVVLKATLRQHGIPAGWVGCDVTAIARRPGGKRHLFVHLIVQHWNQALMNFAPELQRQLMLALDEFEPDVDHSNYIVSWRFSAECGCPYTRMPDPMFWLQDAEPPARESLRERASATTAAARPKFDLPPSNLDRLP
jgi:hypothetical protein